MTMDYGWRGGRNWSGYPLDELAPGHRWGDGVWAGLTSVADNPAKRETVSVRDLALSNAYQLEAMINVLERKGFLTISNIGD